MKTLELLNKKPLYLMKIFLKSHNNLFKLLHHLERTTLTYSLWRVCYLKSYVPQPVIIIHSKPNPLTKIPFNLLSLINTLLLQEKTGVAKSR